MDKLLTPDETAELLNTPIANLSAWRYNGTGPAFIRVGRQIRYRPDDLEAWLESRRVDPMNYGDAEHPPGDIWT